MYKQNHIDDYSTMVIYHMQVIFNIFKHMI